MKHVYQFCLLFCSFISNLKLFSGQDVATHKEHDIDIRLQKICLYTIAPTGVGFLHGFGLLIVSIRSRAHSHGVGHSEQDIRLYGVGHSE